MATKTINQFGTITTLANNDKLPLWQNSSSATKAITYGNFITQVTASLTLSDYVKKDGTVALTGDWDIGASRKISGEKYTARSAAGLRLEDDGSNLGIFVKDGGHVGVGTNDPLSVLSMQAAGGLDSATPPRFTIRNTTSGTFNAVRQEIASVDFYSDDTGGTGARTRARISLENANDTFATADLAFYITSTAGLFEIMRLSGTSEVGIFNSAPLATFHVGAGASSPTVTPTILASIAGATSFVARDATNNIEWFATAGTSRVTMGASSNSALALYTNNAERVTIAAAGSVGIANTSPQATLHVGAGADAPATTAVAIYGSNAGSTALAIRNSTDDVENSLRSGTTTGSVGTTTNHNFAFLSNNTVRATILAAGNFGIGNATPAALLHVGAGADTPTTTATIYGSLAGAVSAVLRDSTNDVEAKWTAGTASTIFGAVTNHPLALYTNNTERVTVLAGGNVGIGNTSAQAALHVGAGADAPTTTATIYASLAGAVSIVTRDSTNDVEAKWTAGTANSVFGTVTSHPLIFFTNNTSRVLLSSGGAMWVNATSSVAGALGAGQVEIDKTSNGTLLLRRDSADTGGPTLEFLKRRNAFDVVSSGDRLGTIAFSGADSVDAANAVQIYAEVDGTPGSNDMPGRLIFATAPDGSATAAEAMRITSAGRVGIGTVSPGYELDVDGGINATTFYKAGVEFTGSSQWVDISGGIEYTGGKIQVGFDTDLASYFGRAEIGYNGTNTDRASFGHLDYAFAIDQGSTGETRLNANESFTFRLGGSDRLNFTTIANAFYPSDNIFSLGVSGGRWTAVWAVNGTIQTSDLTQKRNVRPSVLGLDFIRRLQPISWVWNDQNEPAEVETVTFERPAMETVTIEKEVVERTATGKAIRRTRPVEVKRQKVTMEPVFHANGKPILDKNGNQVMEAVPVMETVTEERVIKPAIQQTHERPHFGLAGQQVKAVIDELGTDFGGYVYDPERDEHSLRYTEFIGPMIAAIQELSKQVDELKMRLQ